MSASISWLPGSSSWIRKQQVRSGAELPPSSQAHTSPPHSLDPSSHSAAGPCRLDLLPPPKAARERIEGQEAAMNMLLQPFSISMVGSTPSSVSLCAQGLVDGGSHRWPHRRAEDEVSSPDHDDLVQELLCLVLTPCPPHDRVDPFHAWSVSSAVVGPPSTSHHSASSQISVPFLAHHQVHHGVEDDVLDSAGTADARSSAQSPDQVPRSAPNLLHTRVSWSELLLSCVLRFSPDTSLSSRSCGAPPSSSNSTRRFAHNILCWSRGYDRFCSVVTCMVLSIKALVWFSSPSLC
eukprot:752515-Hanusia_phi.AAC.1